MKYIEPRGACGDFATNLAYMAVSDRGERCLGLLDAAVAHCGWKRSANQPLLSHAIAANANGAQAHPSVSVHILKGPKFEPKDLLKSIFVTARRVENFVSISVQNAAPRSIGMRISGPTILLSLSARSSTLLFRRPRVRFGRKVDIRGSASVMILSDSHKHLLFDPLVERYDPRRGKHSQGRGLCKIG